MENGTVENKKGNHKFTAVLLQIGKAICYVGLYFGMQIAVSYAALILYIIYERLYILFNGTDMDVLRDHALLAESELLVEKLNSMLPGILIVSGILTLLVLWLFFLIRRRRFRAEVRLKPFRASHWPGILLGAVGLCLFINFGMQLIPIPAEILEEYAESSAGLLEGSFVLLFLSNVVMAPVVEEILFRGLVYGRLRRAMSRWAAILLSSLFFALMHGQILWICYTFLVGIVLCLAAEKADSILASVFIHMMFNLFGTCMGYLVESVPFWLCILMTVAGLICLADAVRMLWPRKARDCAGAGQSE